MTLSIRFIALVIILGALSGCQKPAAPSADSSSSTDTSSEASLEIIDASEGNSQSIICPEQRPEMCTQIYLPVCGTIDTGIRCVTTPCPSEATKTFGNACTACSDTRTLSYIDGECEIETAVEEN